MPWSNLGNFLERFRNIKPPGEFVQSSVVEIVNEVANISINPKNIECKRGMIFMSLTNPAMKSQIFCCKDKIIQEFYKRMGPRAPKDIIFR